MRHLTLLRWLVLTSIGCVGSIPVDPDPTGGDTSEPAACIDPVDLGGGYVRCADGGTDRVADLAQDPTAGRLPACALDEDYLGCTTDAECTDGPNGRCSHFDDLWDSGDSGDSGDSCGCTYACATDADCGVGEACLAGSHDAGHDAPTCVPAACTTASDCASGSCGVAHWYDGCSWTSSLQCRTEADTCASDDDCQDGCGTLATDGSEPFSCSTQDCVVGRPFQVAGAVLTARSTDRSDWSAPLPGLPHAPDVAAHWAWVASCEHASVASFSVVALQLLALGAPPELVDATHQAARDEVRHAQTMYALASAVGGRPVGPGPLPMDGLTLQTDPRTVLKALVEEACVNETVSAALAAEEAACAEASALRELLGAIARDEADHAALGWRTLRWMLDTFPELREEAVQLLLEASTAMREAPQAGSPDRPDLGVLGPEARRRAVHAALERVVLPAVTALQETSAVTRAASPLSSSGS